MHSSSKANDINKKTALKFVILISIVSFFADMTYEGARSITGPYLALLGANASAVGFIAGFGEFIGYALRIVSGYLADRTQKYWTITIIGYICNLLAVPLLALTNHWLVAAFLIVAERAGKAIRVPSRDAMLSHAGQKMGMGWVFGLHEAIDQVGAMLGPLIIALILFLKKDNYQFGFAVLLIPALFAIGILFFARHLYPRPQSLEIEYPNLEPAGMNIAFWFYLIGASLIAAGTVDFSLIAYHFQKSNILSPVWIPIAYAIAMGINSLSAPFFGHQYDRKGFIILIWVSMLSILFAPLVFLGNSTTALIGIALWSIGVSAQESLMQAIVANMIPANKRSSAYGIFNTGFGLFWFIGSFVSGILYDISILYVVIFSVIIQLLAIPVLFFVLRMKGMNK